LHTLERLDNNALFIGSIFITLVIWFYFIQNEFIYIENLQGAFLRSISHNSPRHLFNNMSSLILASSFLFIFVTYRFFLIVISTSLISSMMFYTTYTDMVGFSVATSGLMGAVLVIFLINAYILIRSDRVNKPTTGYLNINTRIININYKKSKLIFGYHSLVFLFFSILRVTDLLIHLGLINRKSKIISNYLLHGSSQIEPTIVIQAHTFGFVTGIITSILIMIWVMIFRKESYKQRLKLIFSDYIL
jgi:hypothetical protein